jgi:putative membrane-bound dehydrogenase-like protein
MPVLTPQERHMTRLPLASLLVCLAASNLLAGPPGPQTHQVQLNGHVFTLPIGFDMELVAGPPLVNRPIEADFDEEGRLYVTDSSGSNDNVEIQVQKKPHRVVRLEDMKGDGHFDRATVFADHLMFPEGAMWHAGSFYAAAAPSIWKFTDTMGKGVADQRVEWFQGRTLGHCANDLHGPYFGPDGWIYWCKGAWAKQTYERPGRPPFVTRASHIFRCRPDGTGIEPVMTGGMDNPVEVAFTAGGERIFTTTFLVHPGGGQRDGLIHDVYGGIYGKDHDVLYEHVWTGPTLMPVLTHLGAAASCGLTRYESSIFGPEYKDNFFSCLFNMHKVMRHVLVPDGATFKTRDEDFLVSNNLDFHPTDVLEDADGSLLVLDTGGWYKLCCPTSQLHKPDILGAIYRVRRHGAAPVADPRGRQLHWEQLSIEDLAGLFDDSRVVVRKRAMQALADKGVPAVSALTKLQTGRTADARLAAVWSLTRINEPSARRAVEKALGDPDETVRQAALNSTGLWRDQAVLPQVVMLLKSPSLQNRRAAAEALGRIGDKSAVPALLEALAAPEATKLSEPAGRVLQHSLTYALIEIGDRDSIAAGLQSDNPFTKRAALIALDKIPGGRLDAAMVAREFTSPNAALKDAAWWIAGGHPEWGDALAAFLRKRLSAASWTAAERDELTQQLARFAKSAAVQKLLADEPADARAAPDARRLVLRAMAQAGLKEAPEPWLSALKRLLSESDQDTMLEALTTARALQVPAGHAQALDSELLRIGKQKDAPANLRLAALVAVPGGLSQVDGPLFDFLIASLGSDQTVAVRSQAVDVLTRGKLQTDQLLALAEALKNVGPLELDRLLEAFAQSSEEAVGLKLIAALKAAPARSSLRPEMIKPRLTKFSPNVHKQAEDLYASLNIDTKKQRARLEQLITSLGDGDIRRGQQVFNSAKVACSSCHAIGYLGGNIGPDLTHIGKIRTERDLLESIVFPSSSFVRSYEPMLVVTKSGQTYNGVVKKDAPDEVVLALAADKFVHLARSDIEEIQLSKVSIMPAGLDQQLTPRELADLVAFLRACK